MPCKPEIFEEIPFFSMLDADERQVLAENVELRTFTAKQRIYKAGEPGSKAYVVMRGKVRVSITDEDNTDVVVDTPSHGEMFGLASMLAEAPHQTTAVAEEDTQALEIDRHDLTQLITRKPMAGLDLLTMIGQQFRSSNQLVRTRVTRNANDVIDAQETLGERLADAVAKFGGSWKFIISFAVVLSIYVLANVMLSAFGKTAWDPYPFILLNLFMSMLASIQAPVIMMSQNRQDARDRLRAELDFAVNRKAETEVTQVLGKLLEMQDRLDDLEEAIKKK